jgi:hypothetical protein
LNFLDFKWLKIANNLAHRARMDQSEHTKSLKLVDIYLSEWVTPINVVGSLVDRSAQLTVIDTTMINTD